MSVFGAVFPIFLIIMAGYALKARFIRSEEFWAQADRLIYFFLMPMMLVQILAQAKFESHMLLKGLTIFGVVSVMAALCFIFKRFIGVSGREFTSVFQGVVRVNFYMSLSIASQLYGKEGIQFLSFLLVFLIPSATIYSVGVLQRYGSGANKGGVVLRLLQNPIIIATFLGLGIGWTFGGLPGVFDETMDIFGDATLPLALLGIGAALEIKSLSAFKPLAACVLLRLIIAPLLCVGVGYALGFSEMETLCCMLIFAVPTAASAISFASQMGGDTRLMSAILTVQTVISFVTLWALITFVHAIY